MKQYSIALTFPATDDKEASTVVAEMLKRGYSAYYYEETSSVDVDAWVRHLHRDCEVCNTDVE